MNEELLKRIKSLLWRAGAVALVAGLAEVSQGLPDLGLPEFAVVLAALVVGEVTKYLNKVK